MGIKFERIEENPSMFQGISVDEAVVIIMMQIHLGEMSYGSLGDCPAQHTIDHGRHERRRYMEQHRRIAV